MNTVRSCAMIPSRWCFMFFDSLVLVASKFQAVSFLSHRHVDQIPRPEAHEFKYCFLLILVLSSIWGIISIIYTCHQFRRAREAILKTRQKMKWHQSCCKRHPRTPRFGFLGEGRPCHDPFAFVFAFAYLSIATKPPLTSPIQPQLLIVVGAASISPSTPGFPCLAEAIRSINFCAAI